VLVEDADGSGAEEPGHELRDAGIEDELPVLRDSLPVAVVVDESSG
jgi:hypothetical protein